MPRDAWLNLVLPLADLAAAVFRPGGGGGGGGLGGSGPLYRSLDSLHLAGTCRLRRVCTLRDAPHLPQEGHDGVSAGAGGGSGFSVRFSIVWGYVV